MIRGNNMTIMSKSILGGSQVFFSNVDLVNKWLSITPLFKQKKEHWKIYKLKDVKILVMLCYVMLCYVMLCYSLYILLIVQAVSTLFYWDLTLSPLEHAPWESCHQRNISCERNHVPYITGILSPVNPISSVICIIIM